MCRNKDLLVTMCFQCGKLEGLETYLSESMIAAVNHNGSSIIDHDVMDGREVEVG